MNPITARTLPLTHVPPERCRTVCPGGPLASPRLLALLRLSLLTLPLLVLSTLHTGCADGCAGDSGTPPDTIVKLTPKIEGPSETVEYGQVNLLTTLTKEIILKNTGAATLSIENVVLAVGLNAGSSVSRFQLVSEPETSVRAGESTTLRVRLEGYSEGSVDDYLIIESDAVNLPHLELPLHGEVVRPIAEAFPTSLNFNDVLTGDTELQSINVQNAGKGTLALNAVNLYRAGVTGGDGTDLEFSYRLPSSFQLGDSLSEGTGIKLDILYAPLDDLQDELELELITSDPKNPFIRIPITANGKVDEPPQVRIITPVEGDSFFTGSTVMLSGQVLDNVDGPESLNVVWVSSLQGSLCPSPVINEDGFFSCTAVFTIVGEHRITLTAFDAKGQAATPVSVTVVVWDEDTPLSYIISGSPDLSVYAFTPDDNILISVYDRDDPNKFTVCVNAVDDIRDPEPPRTCNAKYGDTIRIQAYDRYGSGFSVPILYLWYGRNDEYSQPLNDAVFALGRGDAGYEEVNPDCLPSPTRDEWYLEGGHPDDEPPPDCLVFDESVVVTIPPPEATDMSGVRQ